jgi:lia operon protein LiaG
MTSTVSLRTTPIVGALLALVAFSPARGQTDRRTISGDRVSIYNLAGRLRVQAVGGSQVTVDVTRGGHDAGQLKIMTGEIRGAQSLRVVYPSDRIIYSGMGRRDRTQLRVNSDGTFDDKENGSSFFARDRVEIRDSGSGLDAHADLVVGVPKGQRIAIHWGVGDATVSNVDGDIRISVASATLTSEHTRGHLSLDTGSGSVTVTDALGDVSLDTGSGSVTIDGVRGETLEIDTGSGTLRANNIDVRTLKADVGSGGLRLGAVKASRVSVDAGSGGVDVDLISRVDDLTVDAGSGGVTIKLPASQGAEVNIETGSGGIDSDFAVQTRRVDRTSLHGQIGDGRGRIKIEAGSGRVRLIKGP